MCRPLCVTAIVTSCLVSFVPPVRAQAESSRQDVEQMIARVKMLHSGVFQYGLTSKHDTYTRPVQHDLAFSGGSWMLTSRRPANEIPHKDSTGKPIERPKESLQGDSVMKTINHKGKYAAYQENPQFSGKVTKDVVVKSLDVPLSSTANSSFQPPINLIGTGWNATTVAYIAAHVSGAELRGTKEVNGCSTRVYEWKVPKSERFQAFEGVTDLTQNGGVLRVCIAPDLGYAVPLLECVGTDGRVSMSYSASEYTACNGIWTPRSATIAAFSTKGPGYWAKYTDIRASRLNEHLSDDEFTVELPTGAIIRDVRNPQKTAEYVVRDPASVSNDLSDVLVPEVAHRRPWYRSWWWAVPAGVLVGLLILAGLFAVRILRARGKPA
jgi:hypothetical protein